MIKFLISILMLFVFTGTAHAEGSTLAGAKTLLSKPFLCGTGITLMAASVPLFLEGRKNKKRAERYATNSDAQEPSSGQGDMLLGKMGGCEGEARNSLCPSGEKEEHLEEQEDEDGGRVASPSRTARLQVMSPEDASQTVQDVCEKTGHVCPQNEEGLFTHVEMPSGEIIQAPFGPEEFEEAGLGEEYANSQSEIQNQARKVGAGQFSLSDNSLDSEEEEEEFIEEELEDVGVSRDVISSPSSRGQSQNQEEQQSVNPFQGLFGSTKKSKAKRDLASGNRQIIRVIRRGADKVGSSGGNIFKQISPAFDRLP